MNDLCPSRCARRPIRRAADTRQRRCAIVHQPRIQSSSAGVADDRASETVERADPGGTTRNWRGVARAMQGHFRPGGGTPKGPRREPMDQDGHDVWARRSAALQLPRTSAENRSRCLGSPSPPSPESCESARHSRQLLGQRAAQVVDRGSKRVPVCDERTGTPFGGEKCRYGEAEHDDEPPDQGRSQTARPSRGDELRSGPQGVHQLATFIADRIARLRSE